MPLLSFRSSRPSLLAWPHHGDPGSPRDGLLYEERLPYKSRRLLVGSIGEVVGNDRVVVT